MFGFMRKEKQATATQAPPFEVVRGTGHDGANVRDTISASNACAQAHACLSENGQATSRDITRRFQGDP